MGIEDHITSGSSFCGLDADNRTNVANKVFCWYVPGPNLSPIANVIFNMPSYGCDSKGCLILLFSWVMNAKSKGEDRWRGKLYVSPHYQFRYYQNGVTNRLPRMLLPFCLVTFGAHPLSGFL